jgi:hypothetical protein
MKGTMRKVRVLCTFEIEVEIPDEANAHFVIEENGCPGTGAVGEAIRNLIEAGDEANFCWACNCKGENKILSIT